MLTFGIPHHIFIGRDFFPVRDDDSDIIDNAGLQDSQVNSPCCDERRLSSSILQDQDEQDCMCYVDVVFFHPPVDHTVRNLHFLSKNSTLISRENY